MRNWWWGWFCYLAGVLVGTAQLHFPVSLLINLLAGVIIMLAWHRKQRNRDVRP